MDDDGFHQDPIISISNNDRNESNTTSIVTNQHLRLTGMMTTDNNNSSPPDSLIPALDTSLLKLQQNLAHNRAVFTAKANGVLGKLREMEEEVNKALQSLGTISPNQYHIADDKIMGSVHSKDSSIVDEQQL